MQGINWNEIVQNFILLGQFGGKGGERETGKERSETIMRNLDYKSEKIKCDNTQPMM